MKLSKIIQQQQLELHKKAKAQGGESPSWIGQRRGEQAKSSRPETMVNKP